MKKLILIPLLLLIPIVVHAQTASRLSGGPGVPTHNCNPGSAIANTVADTYVRTGVNPHVLYICSAAPNVWTVSSGSGSGTISDLNGQTGATQTFARTNDTNVTLTISSSVNTHTFAIGWQSTLAKNRQHAATVYTDQVNTFGAFAQDFRGSDLYIARRASAPGTPVAGQIYQNTGDTKPYFCFETGTCGEVFVAGLSLVNLVSNVTGTLAESHGGTGQSTYTKGDILASPGTNLNKLAVGTDGQVLTADAASTNGVKWAAAGGGSSSLGTNGYWAPEYWTWQTASSGLGATAANEVRVYRSCIATSLTVNSIHTYIVDTNAGTFGGVGVYSSDGNTKLIDSGAISTTTGGVKSVTLGSPVTLTAGCYWIAFTMSNINPDFLGVNLAANPVSVVNAGTQQGGTAANASSAGVLPSTLGTITTGNTTRIALKLQN